MCATYNELLDAGWHMTDIDNMDMPGFLRLRAWRARQKKQKATPRRKYIDEAWGKTH